MRKNSARKWLHATLDLLPVVIIPIFALYATNKNATFAQEITVSQNKVVDFNQQVKNGDFSTLDNWNIISNDYVSIELVNGACLETIDETGHSRWQYGIYQVLNDIVPNNKYLLRASTTTNTIDTQLVVELGGSGQTTFNIGTNESVIIEPTINYNDQILIYPVQTPNVSDTFTFDNIQLFNLTQMFGSGNEPSVEQFNQWYPNDYYDYTLSDKQLLKDYDQITYNDTDIGSQFMYGLYNSVDKYFNIGNVFNLGSIYDWLNLNIFNGNSPIAIYIVWNIVAYEFLMDLLFLLYGLFMFFIDTCTNLMDRFYCNLSGRR